MLFFGRFSGHPFGPRRLVLAVCFGLGALSARAEAPLCLEPQPAAQRVPSSISESNGVIVLPTDPDVHAENLRASGYQVQPVDSSALGSSAPDPWRDPSPTLRNRMLAAAHLKSLLTGWDQLALDQLFLRAQAYSLVKLCTKYPRLPKERLAALQSAIAKEKQ